MGESNYTVKVKVELDTSDVGKLRGAGGGGRGAKKGGEAVQDGPRIASVADLIGMAQFDPDLAALAAEGSETPPYHKHLAALGRRAERDERRAIQKREKEEAKKKERREEFITYSRGYRNREYNQAGPIKGNKYAKQFDHLHQMKKILPDLKKKLVSSGGTMGKIARGIGVMGKIGKGAATVSGTAAATVAVAYGAGRVGESAASAAQVTGEVLGVGQIPVLTDAIEEIRQGMVILQATITSAMASLGKTVSFEKDAAMITGKTSLNRAAKFGEQTFAGMVAQKELDAKVNSWKNRSFGKALHQSIKDMFETGSNQ